MERGITREMIFSMTWAWAIVKEIHGEIGAIGARIWLRNERISKPKFFPQNFQVKCLVRRIGSESGPSLSWLLSIQMKNRQNPWKWRSRRTLSRSNIQVFESSPVSAHGISFLQQEVEMSRTCPIPHDNFQLINLYRCAIWGICLCEISNCWLGVFHQSSLHFSNNFSLSCELFTVLSPFPILTNCLWPPVCLKISVNGICLTYVSRLSVVSSLMTEMTFGASEFDELLWEITPIPFACQSLQYYSRYNSFR